MPEAIAAAPSRSNSLGRRLRREPVALAALATLIAVVLACLIGPALTGHAPTRIYPDLVRRPPSLQSAPSPAEIRPVLDRLAFRMRLSIDAASIETGTVRLGLSSDKPIDPRALGYLPRSDLFGPAKIRERSEEGRRLVVEAPIRESWFPLGTDMLGRDLLTRCLTAGRISLLVGLAATLVALLVGVTYGAVAGMAGGAVDAVMMRIVDAIYALPFVFFVIVLLVFFRSGLILVLVAVAAVEWLDMARIVRTQTLALKSRDFVRATEALGLSRRAVLVRHIVPNTLGPIIVASTLLVPRVILLESFLSFLGLGVQEPATSWGVLIAEGARALEATPWTLAAPGSFLVVTLIALNLLGDRLADILALKR